MRLHLVKYQEFIHRYIFLSQAVLTFFNTFGMSDNVKCYKTFLNNKLAITVRSLNDIKTYFRIVCPEILSISYHDRILCGNLSSFLLITEFFNPVLIYPILIYIKENPKQD